MRTGPVGQKCPACVQVPRRARGLGKPGHYVRALGAGLVTAVVGGIVYLTLLRGLPFGTLILAGILGFGVGRAVRWGNRGQTLPPWPALAAGVAVVGLLGTVVVVTRTFPVNVWLLLAHAVAGWFAVRGLQS